MDMERNALTMTSGREVEEGLENAYTRNDLWCVDSSGEAYILRMVLWSTKDELVLNDME
jgi:hypothetical protein